MLKYSIVEFCSDLSCIQGLDNQDDLFSKFYEGDDQRILTIYISGILSWHAVEKLLIGKGIIFSGEQLISLFCRAFESTDEVLSLSSLAGSVILLN